MARFLHLLKSDSAPVAAPVIAQNARQPGDTVTVVLLGDVTAPPLPTNVQIRRFGDQGLDYSSLLDLIFESDHVMSW